MISYDKFISFGIEIPEDKKPNAKGNVYVQCPECSKTRHHQEKSNLPVLGVNVIKGCWGCNNCGWSGSINKTIKIDQDFQKKVNLARKPIDYGLENPVVKWFWDKRKISIDTLRRNRVFFGNSMILIKHSTNVKEVGKFHERHCIYYPYYEQGEISGLKYRDKDKNFGAVSGGRSIFYGIDDIQFDDWCLIVEGENDKLAWSEVKVQNCLSVPNGAQISEEERKKIINGEAFESQMNLEYVDNCIDYLKHIKKFIIATDDDPPGIKLRNELARRLGKHRCCYVKYYGKKDSNQLLIEDGPEKLLSLLDNTIDFPIDNIVFAADVYNDLEYEYVHGKQKGYSLGWKCLDPHFTLRKGDLIIGNGYPGMGKSTFDFNLMINTAIMYDWKWGAYFPENYPEKRVYDTMAEILIGNSSDRDYDGRMSLTQYKGAILDFLHKHIILVGNKNRYTPKEMNNKIGEMISKYGIIGFATDPWNSLKHNMKGRNIDDYLEDVLSDEVEFATKNEIVKIINTHPPTPPRDKNKDYPAPSYFEIRGGQIWAAKAYVVYCLHLRALLNDFTDTTVEFHVQKSKDHKLIGRPTQRDNPILLIFKRKSNRYYEMISDVKGGKMSNPIEEYKHLLTNQINIDI